MQKRFDEPKLDETSERKLEVLTRLMNDADLLINNALYDTKEKAYARKQLASCYHWLREAVYREQKIRDDKTSTKVISKERDENV